MNKYLKITILALVAVIGGALILLTLSIGLIYGLNWLAINTEYIDLQPVAMNATTIILGMIFFGVVGARNNAESISELKQSITYDINQVQNQLATLNESALELDGIKRSVEEIATEINNR